jgi:hypothetical protein
MIKSGIAAVAATLLIASAAHAGPALDKAQAHFKAIGAGDVAAITADYSESAALLWIGGPLDGHYAGRAPIQGVWTKFTGAQGKLDVTMSNVQENANPKGATVTANVQFKGQNTIKVRYVLTYRDDKLVSEIWQIDPALVVASY